jgi:hypothetical protein
VVGSSWYVVGSWPFLILNHTLTLDPISSIEIASPE